MLIAGCLDDAAAQADDTFMLAAQGAKSGSKTEGEWLPDSRRACSPNIVSSSTIARLRNDSRQ